MHWPPRIDGAWKLREQVHASDSLRPLPEIFEFGRRILPKVIEGHFGIAIGHAGEESGNISPVLTEQRPGIVLWMPLHEEE
jgi:hypothetical protein